MQSVTRLAFAAALLSNLPPAIAHHSYAMFDLQKHATVSGTVAKIEWSNPHIFIWMYGPDAKGAQVLYGIEGGSVSLLTRYGWTQSTLKSGEKVTVEYFPLKDQRPGGAFIKLTHADGTVSSNEPFAPGGTDPSAYRTGKPAQSGK